MRKPFVEPSGVRRDRFTDERISTGEKPKLDYQYGFSINYSNISGQIKRVDKICRDAFAIEQRIRSGALKAAEAQGIKLRLFSISVAAEGFGVDGNFNSYSSFYHRVQDKLDLNFRDMAGHLQDAVEGVRGYELGQKPLEAYQHLLIHCPTIFWIKAAIEVSENSPGIFDEASD